jgi:hypothetical protein
MVFVGGQFVAAGVLEAAWFVPAPAPEDVLPDSAELPDDGAVPDVAVPAADEGSQSEGTTFFLFRECCTVDFADPAGFWAGVELDGAGVD